MNSEEQQNLDEIRQYYDGVYYKNRQASLKVTAHLRRLAEKLQLTQDHAVLDVACGAGEWLLACADQGARPHGVDLSSKAIAICKQNLPQGEFHACSAETLPFEDNRFDLITCLGSLEHFVKPELAIAEMLRVAKKGARFILLVPNQDFLTRKLGLFGGTDQVNAKEEVKTLNEWQELFESSGLVVKKRWKDLHVLSYYWVFAKGTLHAPLRLIQALMLVIWPLKWQYQVYHLCSMREK